VNHAANHPESIPRVQPAIAATRAVASSAQDSDFWPSLLMAAAITSIAVGIIWDISWHETVGRDTFWTPAHMAIYLGGVLAGCTSGWLAIKYTFFGGQKERDASVSVFGARAPLGAWVAIWGAVAMITSAPFDNWWHNAYGLDVKIISPPHAVLGLGMLGISVGSLLMVLARQNRLLETSRKGGGLFIYTGGVFVLLGAVFLLEYIFPNEQHGGTFYVACMMMFPSRFVALSYAGRTRLPATGVAAVYMALLCVVDWILMLFPAHPKLAPIFNAVTHMVALPFPLLLIFPALAVDLVLWKTRETRGILKLAAIAIALGTVYLAVFIPVQWFSSEFLISKQAANWFFMGDRIWGYGEGVGNWWHEFWRQNAGNSDADLLTVNAVVKSWVIAIIGAAVGLFFGRWMRKVRR
jgi:hypothetical protein